MVIDEVRKHWAAIVWAMLELLSAARRAAAAFARAGAGVVGAGRSSAAPSSLHAGWRILERKTDRFVITNMRVFRVHGILTQNIATMPLSRILDISVHKPIIGRIFGYGHFIFESAAQEQGLREIRFVGDPDQRGLTIQRVIQQAGLRGFNRSAAARLRRGSRMRRSARRSSRRAAPIRRRATLGLARRRAAAGARPRSPISAARAAAAVRRSTPIAPRTAPIDLPR